MGNISTLAVPAASPVPIVATRWGNAVVVQESPAVADWPTTDLLFYKNSSSSTPIRVVSGNTYQFTNRGGGAGLGFAPGDTVGWVQAVAADTTVVIDETEL